MSKRSVVLYCFLVTAMFLEATAIPCRAQVAAQPAESSATNSGIVPQAMRFNGVALNRAGDTVEAVFRVYTEPEGGEPLWTETQRVTVDRDGNYAVLLGAGTEGGLPQSLFAGGNARWLGISIERAPELPRVALVSVAYAMKAADAETLAGVPASEFVTRSQLQSGSVGETHGSATPAASAARALASPTGSGTANTIPLWTKSNVLGNSILTQSAGTVTAKGSIDASSATGAAAISGANSSTKGTAICVSLKAHSAANCAAGVSGIEDAKTGEVYGVFGETVSTTDLSAGVTGYEAATTGEVFGVQGTTKSSTTNAAGVNGYEGASTGQVYGVSGVSNSTGTYSAGVAGASLATSGQVSGVSGYAVSPAGTAVGGYEGALTGEVSGVSGGTASPSGNGVFGGNYASTGFAVGVTGVTYSSGGVGVHGTNNAATGGIGLSGETQKSGTAILGGNRNCVNGNCTYAPGTALSLYTGSGGTLISAYSAPAGSSKSTSPTTTEFTVDSSGNGFFHGDLNVTGKLTKGSGSFKIDHPLDPANKYLSHSFVESPDMMNIYNGNVITDKHGMATVVLPDYFEPLNRDFRYQLTVVGTFAQAIVAAKVAHNRFVIRTNKPHVEVSWQVTGIRQDAYANANRIPVEEDKPETERGYYLHPELFGLPADKGLAGARAAVTPQVSASAPAR